MASSPPARWSDLAGRRVGLWGLGVEGGANLRKLRSLGVEPPIVEDHPRGGGEGVLPLDRGGLKALSRCEVVVKTPGVSRYRPEVTLLERAGVAVVGGLGLWLEEVDRRRVLLVTGTKGKSTTVSVIGHLLRGLGRSAFVGGNLGAVPYDPEVGSEGAEWWVIEVSSYQVLDLWSASPVVGVTSLSADHLTWHGGTVERYYADKLSLTDLPGRRLTVANGTDPGLRAEAHRLSGPVRWVEEAEVAAAGWSEGLGLLGWHNRANAALARACLVEAGVGEAEEPEALAEAARGFRSLPSRLQRIATVGAVEFVDDSLSTNVLPTMAALDAFGDRRVALLAGGFDRGIDYRPLAEHLRRRVAPTLLVTLPDNGPRIRSAVEEAPLPEQLQVIEGREMDRAVAAAFAWARPDGVVLLSPAAPSFGRYRDYRERSLAFAEAVRTCRESP